MKWQSFNMPFVLSLILHPANSFKKGKVPIVKQMLPVMVRSVCATKYSVEHLRHFKHKTIAKSLLETTTSVRKSGISWRKSHSFYTRGIPLKDRRSIRIFRAHAWKKKLHFEPSKCSMEHLQWGHFQRRVTRVDTDGCCTQAMDVSQKWICPEKQSLYSGDTKVFVIRIMLISLFSPGARQSFFSTITQSAGRRSVYLHCVWKSPHVKVLWSYRGFRWI